MLASIRSAIAEYLTTQTAGSQYISQVFAAPPVLTTEQYLQLPTNPTNTGAIVTIYLESASHSLITLGGQQNGIYKAAYNAKLVLTVMGLTGDAIAAQNLMDNAMDELTQIIMSNKQANTPSAIFTWGLGDGVSADDITIDMELPNTITLQTVEIWGTLGIVVLEMIQGGVSIG